MEYNAADRAAYNDQKQKEADQRIAALAESWQQNPEEIAEYLKFRQQFHQYSAKNMMLIYVQNPQAQFVGSFSRFKELGYNVKRGEHGMGILAPNIREYYRKSPTSAWRPLNKDTPAEDRRLAAVGAYEIQKKVNGYRVSTVFEIGQTDCPLEDYPKYLGLGYNSEQHAVIYKAACEYCTQIGFPVAELPLPMTLRGQCMRDGITINETMGDTQKLNTLFHELGHGVLGHVGNPDISTAREEFEADAFSVLMSYRYGIEVTDGRKAHLAHHYSAYRQEILDAGKEPDITAMMEPVNRQYLTLEQRLEQQLDKLLDREPVTPVPDETSEPEVMQTPTQSELTETSDHIHVEGHNGTWYVIANETINGTPMFLLESEQYGDEAAGLIVDKTGALLVEDVYNGFDDYRERISASKNDEVQPVTVDAKTETEFQFSASAPVEMFEIYQLKHGLSDPLFLDYQSLLQSGQSLDAGNYECVYTDDYRGESMDQLYYRFNVLHPDDFRGHSLSVSDVVVVTAAGDQHAYFVDSIGFKDVPEFLEQLKTLAEPVVPPMSEETVDAAVAEAVQQELDSEPRSPAPDSSDADPEWVPLHDRDGLRGHYTVQHGCYIMQNEQTDQYDVFAPGKISAPDDLYWQYSDATVSSFAEADDWALRQSPIDHPRVFVDMDGTLAQFHSEVNYLERMWEPGFFEGLKPYENAVEGLRQYMADNPDAEVFALSAAIQGEPPSCAAQKNAWLDEHLPEIDAQHRLFPPVGTDKTAIIPGGVRETDVLIDDYNANLEQWRDAGGKSVKFVNHINDKGLVGERWKGDRIWYNHTPESFSGDLAAQTGKVPLQKTETEFQFSKDLKAALKLKARMPRLSMENLLRIQAAHPDAVKMATALQYQQHGYKVREGEKPVKIQRREYTTEPNTQKAVLKTTPVMVYDIQQTDCPQEIIDRIRSAKPAATPAELTERITAWAALYNIQTEYTAMKTPMTNGGYDEGNNRLLVNIDVQAPIGDALQGMMLGYTTALMARCHPDLPTDQQQSVAAAATLVTLQQHGIPTDKIPPDCLDQLARLTPEEQEMALRRIDDCTDVLKDQMADLNPGENPERSPGAPEEPDTNPIEPDMGR